MFDPAHLVFVDETAANTKMVRLSGRCRRGERLIGRVPQGHWKTITFVAALRRNGMRAPCTVDGAMNGTKFLAHVKQCLAQPSSTMITAGSTIFMRTKLLVIARRSKRVVPRFVICPNTRPT